MVNRRFLKINYDKKKLYVKYINKPSLYIHQIRKLCRNRLNQVMRKAERDHYASLFTLTYIEVNSGSLGRLLKKLLPKRKRYAIDQIHGPSKSS